MESDRARFRQRPNPAAWRRFHSVRQNQSPAARRRRSAAISRRTVRYPRGLRCPRQIRRRAARVRALPAAGRCRPAGHAGGKKQRLALSSSLALSAAASGVPVRLRRPFAKIKELAVLLVPEAWPIKYPILPPLESRAEP